MAECYNCRNETKEGVGFGQIADVCYLTREWIPKQGKCRYYNMSRWEYMEAPGINDRWREYLANINDEEESRKNLDILEAILEGM